MYANPMDPVGLQVDIIPTSSSSLYISFTWGRVDRNLYWFAWEQQVTNILGNWKIRDRFALITQQKIGPIPQLPVLNQCRTAAQGILQHHGTPTTQRG